MFITLWRRLGAWMQRLDAARRLAILDDRLLADMGIEREDIARRVSSSSETPSFEGPDACSVSAAPLSAHTTSWHGLYPQPKL